MSYNGSDKYKLIFDNAPIGIWEEDWSDVKKLIDKLRPNIDGKNLMSYLNNDPDFVQELVKSVKVIRVNKKVIEMYEADSEDDLKKCIGITFSKKSLDTFKEEIVALYKGEQNIETEAETKTLKNNPLYVSIQISLPTKESDYNNVIVVMTDMTPDKTTHRKYLESKAKFHRAFYQGVVGMVICDLGGNILETNESFCKFLGYSKKELEGKNLSISEADNKDHNSIKEDIQKLISNGNHSIQGERMLKNKNGDFIWGYIGLNLIRDEDNNPLYFIGQVIDISEEKAITTLLHENVKKYQQLLNQTNALFVILNENGDIIDCSETFLLLFRGTYSSYCSGNKSLRGLISSESISLFDEAWLSLKEGKTINSLELALSKDTTFKWVIANASMLQNGGKKIFFLMSDITEKKKKEFEQLIAKEKRRDKIRKDIQGLRKTIKNME